MHVVWSNIGMAPKKESIGCNAAYRHATKSNIETHTKETLLSRIGWLLKRAGKKKSDSAAKKD